MAKPTLDIDTACYWWQRHQAAQAVAALAAAPGHFSSALAMRASLSFENSFRRVPKQQDVVKSQELLGTTTSKEEKQFV